WAVDGGGPFRGHEVRLDEHAGLEQALRVRHPRLHEDRAAGELHHRIHEVYLTDEVAPRDGSDPEGDCLPRTQRPRVALRHLERGALRRQIGRASCRGTGWTC